MKRIFKSSVIALLLLFVSLSVKAETFQERLKRSAQEESKRSAEDERLRKALSQTTTPPDYGSTKELVLKDFISLYGNCEYVPESLSRDFNTQKCSFIAECRKENEVPVKFKGTCKLEGSGKLCPSSQASCVFQNFQRGDKSTKIITTSTKLPSFDKPKNPTNSSGQGNSGHH